MRTGVAVLVLGLVIAACGSQARSVPTPTSAPPTAVPSQSLSAAFATPEPSQALGSASTVVALPQTVTSTVYPGLEVSLDQVMIVTSMTCSGSAIPAPAGEVFVAFKVTYKATGGDGGFNNLDWGVSGGTTLSGVCLPGPELGTYGPVPAGTSISGWILYDAPEKGQLTITWDGSPPLAVIVRVS